MRHTLILTIAAAAMLSPSYAHAQAAAPSVRVSYADLNLSTTHGRERFQRRLAAAIKRVCPSAYARELVTQQNARRCVAETGASLDPIVASLTTKQGVALASVTPSNVPAVH